MENAYPLTKAQIRVRRLLITLLLVGMLFLAYLPFSAWYTNSTIAWCYETDSLSICYVHLPDTITSSNQHSPGM
jgi:Na+-transporting NADH:ubiquinone oxidoreductase subunit NqrB